MARKKPKHSSVNIGGGSGGGGGTDLDDIEKFKIIIGFVSILCYGVGLIAKFCCCYRSETPLSLLSCLSAGLFLTMALMHLYPMAVLNYLWAEVQGIEKAFPLP